MLTAVASKVLLLLMFAGCFAQQLHTRRRPDRQEEFKTAAVVAASGNSKTEATQGSVKNCFSANLLLPAAN